MLVSRHGIVNQLSRTNFKMLEEERGDGKESANMVLLLGLFHVVFETDLGNRTVSKPAETSIITFIVVLQLRRSQVFMHALPI